MSLREAIEDFESYRDQLYWINSGSAVFEYEAGNPPSSDPYKANRYNDLLLWEWQLLEHIKYIRTCYETIISHDDDLDQREAELDRWQEDWKREVYTEFDEELLKKERKLDKTLAEAEKRRDEINRSPDIQMVEMREVMLQLARDRVSRQKKIADNMRETYDLMLADIKRREAEVLEKEKMVGIVGHGTKFGDKSKSRKLEI